MAYNRWLSATQVASDDLLHYGVVGMKWGVHKARGYLTKSKNTSLTPEQRAEYLKKYNAAVANFKSKSRAKLESYDSKYRRYQDLANRSYSKSQKKMDRLILKDYTGAEKAQAKGSKYQSRANRIANKEKRFYEEMVKSYRKLNLSPDKDLQKRGEEIIRKLDLQSQMIYATGGSKKHLKHSMADIGISVTNIYLGNEVVDGFDLVHHGVKGQKKGERNGPPYPLYRQERFSKDGKHVDKDKYAKVQASGSHTNPSQHKKAVKNAHAEAMAIRKANPGGTDEDKKEKNSLLAKIKRAQREKEAKEKAYEDAYQKNKQAFANATKRLNESDLPDEEKHKIKTSVPINADVINKAIDDYHTKYNAEREEAKRSGTAEEVMKFRKSYTTEEWRDIANRLEAEARVAKFLNKPVENLPKQKNQNNDSDDNSYRSDKDVSKGLRDDDKKMFDSGDARTIFKNRTKFNADQLEAINRRLKAEDNVGQYAQKQVQLDSDRYIKFQKGVKWLKAVGDGADGAYKIAKLIDPTLSWGKNGQNKQASVDKTVEKLDKILKILGEKGNGNNNGGGDNKRRVTGHRK